MVSSKMLEMDLGETSFKGKKVLHLNKYNIYFNKGILVCSSDKLILTNCFNTTNV